MSNYNITDFGARVCDQLQTDAIQQAIDVCFLNGGGRVIIPTGIFRTGGLRLRSNVELYLQTGAILEGSRNPDDYYGYLQDTLEPITDLDEPNIQRKRSVYPYSRWNNAVIRAFHAKNKPLAPDVDLHQIAATTVGFTGADLENLLNEAALLAAKRKLMAITMNEIEEATMKVVVGSEKKSRKISEKDKKITAYHEAGHAISSYYLENKDPVTHISIVPRGMAAGFTLYTPEQDKTHLLKSRMLDDIVSLLGGRVAEQIIFNDISTGASNDIQRATETARNMITKYGMSEKLGPIAFGSDNDEVFLGKNYTHTRNYSETVAAVIDEEVENIINNAYKRTEAILREHIDQLHIVSEALIKLEKIDKEQFESLMTTGTLPSEEVEESATSTEEKIVEDTEITENNENV